MRTECLLPGLRPMPRPRLLSCSSPSRESVEMHVTFTDVAAPCRTPVTLPGLRYNLISPWGRPKNLARKFPNLLNLASHHPLSLWKVFLWSWTLQSDPKKDGYGTQIKGKTEFCFFWAESHLCRAAFILSGGSRLCQFINCLTELKAHFPGFQKVQVQLVDTENWNLH